MKVPSKSSTLQSSCDGEDNLAELLVVFEALMGFGGAVKWQNAIDHRFEQPAFEKLKHRKQLRLRSHERSED